MQYMLDETVWRPKVKPVTRFGGVTGFGVPVRKPLRRYLYR